MPAPSSNEQQTAIFEKLNNRIKSKIDLFRKNVQNSEKRLKLNEKAHKSENLVTQFNTQTHSKIDLNIEACAIKSSENS